MIENFIRPYTQPYFFDPAVRILSKKIHSPLTLTLISLFLGLLVLPLILLDFRIAAIAMLWLSGLFDVLDGTYARTFGKSSPFGAVMDILSDRIVEFTVIFALYLFAPDERALLSLLMLGSIFLCVTSFLVVGLFTENQGKKSFHYSPGLMERAEAFIFFSLMILFPQLFLLLGVLFVTLVLLTTAVRIWEFRN